jgi:hypothetical protein
VPHRVRLQSGTVQSSEFGKLHGESPFADIPFCSITPSPGEARPAAASVFPEALRRCIGPALPPDQPAFHRHR